MDYDMTWKNPSGPQLAALEYACRALGVKTPKEEGALTHHFFVTSEAIGRSLAVDSGVAYKAGMSEYDYAELILLAEHSLWYSECKNHAGSPSCKFILEVVGLGYRDGKWWDTSRLDPKRVEEEKLRLYTLQTLFRAGASPFISQGFIPVIDLILGRQWKTNFRKEWREQQPYKATKCIKPDCNNMVAPIGIEPHEGDYKNYRGTGACQKGHNGYACPHCSAPHSYASGVGKEHLKYLVGQ